MNVQVLVENTGSEGICGEHGLCLHVAYNGKKYLIDSGASGLFAVNAGKMGVDLQEVNMAFLSHAHYDHAGGYPEFFRQNQKAKVYLQQAARGRFFYKITDSVKKYIGIPEGILEQYENRFEFVNGIQQVDEGVYIVSHSSTEILERAKRTHMCVIIGEQVVYDDFTHEQIVIFEEVDGLVCFNSCSHSGVDVSIEEVKAAFPDKRVKAYFGGFHMMGVSGVDSCSYCKEEVYAVAKRICEGTDAQFYSGHCTGTIAYAWLKDIMGDRLHALYSGEKIEL